MLGLQQKHNNFIPMIGGECTCNHGNIHVLARQVDPTRTKTLRDRFAADVTRRFRKVARLIRESVDTNDCFGLREQPITLEAIPEREFEFLRDDEKLVEFMKWLREQVQENVFEIVTYDRIGETITGLWTNLYIDSAYKQGIRRARQEMRKAGAEVPDIGNDYIDEINVAFNSAVHSDRVAVLYTRVFEELEGITSVMDQQISRILSEGLIQGWSPERIARELVDRVEKIGITRARMLARTEIIRAHHLATVQEYRNAEIQGVTVQAEFTTAGDGRVCTRCKALARNKKKETIIYTLDQIEGLIPVHPN
jgi:hypothetical protein